MNKEDYLTLCGTYCVICEFNEDEKNIILKSIEDLYDNLINEGVAEEDIESSLGAPKDIVNVYYEKYNEIKNDDVEEKIEHVNTEQYFTKSTHVKKDKDKNKNYNKKNKNRFIQFIRLIILAGIAVVIVMPVFAVVFLTLLGAIVTLFLAFLSPLLYVTFEILNLNAYTGMPSDWFSLFATLFVSGLSAIGIAICLGLSKVLFFVTKRFFSFFS